ncbi:MAG: hypothetical protein CVV54_08945 [Synergistetes bacterium HGW-Synergistetes-1]|nr:MAG: hypothetical protein CVV54_08945 [Synergistetes bacterium HGW-Synergistetes-1]
MSIGPIAAVRDGDIITIDVEKKKLDVDLSPEELEARLKDWKRPPPEGTERYPGHICKTGRLSSRRRHDESLAQ